MRRLALALAVGGALLGAGAPAAAEDVGGRFGLGVDTSLGLSADSALTPRLDGAVLRQSFRIPGLAATFYLTDFLGLQLIASYQLDDGDLFVASDGTLVAQESSLTTFGTAFRVLLTFLREDEAHLTFITGASFAWRELGFPNMPDIQQWRFSAEAGLRPEWFVSESFSLHTQIGVSFSLWAFDPGDMVERQGWDFSVFGNANLLGNAGFTWWF